MTDEEYINNISSISTEELFHELAYYGCDTYYADLWRATIEELKKRAEERPKGKWIPVGKRLPKEKLINPSGSDFGFDFEEVLCTTIWGDVRAYKFGKPMGHDKPHFWLGGGIMDEYVIA